MPLPRPRRPETGTPSSGMRCGRAAHLVYREIKDFCPVPRDMSDEGVTFTVAHRNDRPVPLERGRGARLGILFTVCLVILSAGVGIGARPVSASCTPGWVLISQQDDSFTWDEGFLSIRAVSWTGSVRLLENLDSDCYVTDITLRYTGPLPGGTLEVTGDPFVSFTVQYPDPFVDSGDVATNAYGDLFSWNPHTAPLVQPRFEINDRGADEDRDPGLRDAERGVVQRLRAPPGHDGVVRPHRLRPDVRDHDDAHDVLDHAGWDVLRLRGSLRRHDDAQSGLHPAGPLAPATVGGVGGVRACP